MKKMTKNIYNRYKNLLTSLSAGYGRRYVENPAIDFRNRVHNGELNALSDEEYNQVLDSIREESRIWLGMPRSNVVTLVAVMFENIDFTEDDIDKLMDVIYDAYARTDMSAKPDLSTPGNPNERVRFDAATGLTESKADKTAKANDVHKNEQKAEKNYPWDDFTEDESVGETVNEIAEDFSTPKKIYDYLNTYVYGQDKAKKEAAMLMWNHMRGNKRNIVMAGPTGCGKTEIFRTLSNIYPNIAIFDATQFTGEGWKGSVKLKDIFINAQCDDPEHMIVVLDEADKMLESQINCNSNVILQNELLKMIEGDVIRVKTDGPMPEERIYDTSNISFVFMGSFENLMKGKGLNENKNGIGFTGSVKDIDDTDMYDKTITVEDLIEYANVRPEIAGRIDSIVQLELLKEEDFYRILCNNKISPIKKAERQYNINVKMSDVSKRNLARLAMENKRGVRFLNGYIRKNLDDQLFANCQKKSYVIE